MFYRISGQCTAPRKSLQHRCTTYLEEGQEEHGSQCCVPLAQDWIAECMPDRLKGPPVLQVREFHQVCAASFLPIAHGSEGARRICQLESTRRIGFGSEQRYEIVQMAIFRAILAGQHDKVGGKVV